MFQKVKCFFLTCNGQDGFYALASDGVVDHAEVLAGVLDHRLPDDEGAADLLHSLVQLDQLLVLVSLHKFVPSKKIMPRISTMICSFAFNASQVQLFLKTALCNHG